MHKDRSLTRKGGCCLDRPNADPAAIGGLFHETSTVQTAACVCKSAVLRPAFVQMALNRSTTGMWMRTHVQMLRRSLLP